MKCTREGCSGEMIQKQKRKPLMAATKDGKSKVIGTSYIGEVWKCHLCGEEKPA